MKLRVDTKSPAVYARAVSPILDDGARLELRLTCRPKAQYIFVAAYVVRVADANSWMEECYSTDTVPFRKGDNFLRRIQDIIQDEVRALVTNTRSPSRPHIGVAWPLISRLAVRCGGDALEVQHGFPDAPFRVKLNQEQFAALPADEQMAGRQLLDTLAPYTALRDGPRPRVDPRELPADLREATGFFEQLLRLLPARQWPPFNSALGLKTFLKAHVRGSEADIARLAKLLLTRQRRPKARDLAFLFLQEKTGLAARRLRDLTRQ